MEQKNNLLPKKITILDKIKTSILKAMGYRECGKYILDIEPVLRDYSYLDLSRIADKEKKLKEVIDENNNKGELTNGISKEDAESILEWVVQNAREMFIKDFKITTDELKKDSLAFCCGFGQSLTGYPLKYMELSPNICNAREVFHEKAEHAFLTVGMPIKDEEGNVTEKDYLVDTTYKQFYQREFGARNGNYIKDKKFGNRVSETPGYYTLKMKNGEKFAKELLSKGFVEFTEENAKIYGDSFVLSEQSRKDYTKIPTGKELKTNISGKEYINNTKNPKLQVKLDHEDNALEKMGINVRTPLMKKEEMEKKLKESKLSENNKIISNKTENENINEI